MAAAFQALSDLDQLPLPTRFSQIKRNLITGNEAAVAASWTRLLHLLRSEIDLIVATGSSVIPSLDFEDIHDPVRVAQFSRQLRNRGAAVIRNVVPQSTAQQWKEETFEYLQLNPQSKGYPQHNPQQFDLFWSPGQINARAHPNLLEAQRFAMGAVWRSSKPDAPVSHHHPVSYADRVRIRTPGDTGFYLGPHLDGGSVERWEPDGYGRSGTYKCVFEGRWEEFDPWDASARLGVSSDLYKGASACSMFRMFQGWVSLSHTSPGEGTLQVLPLLQLTTAYLLLRPFFSPRIGVRDSGIGGIDSPNGPLNFFDADNWTLDPKPSSIIQGAVPGYTQELSTLLHPHLQLKRSMVSIPRVRPGDYVIWHPDCVHAVDRIHLGGTDSSVMYIPACPLTQTNALYLASQRRAFLLGHPGPDFANGYGEANYMGRPGVGEVNDAGGEEGLRAMGLLPFEAKRPEGRRNEKEEKKETELVRMANAILFPDRFDMGQTRL